MKTYNFGQIGKIYWARRLFTAALVGWRHHRNGNPCASVERDPGHSRSHYAAGRKQSIFGGARARDARLCLFAREPQALPLLRGR